MVRLSAALAAGISLVLTAQADAQTAPTAASWRVDKAASSLGFRSAFSGAAVDGSFRNWDAKIHFDPRNLPASRVSVVVQTAAIAVRDNPDAQEALPSFSWFNAPRFPQATFVAQDFRHLGGPRYQARGTLTIKGVSQPAVLPFTLTIAGNQAKMSGSLVIDRSRFGVGLGQFRTAEAVPFNVTVNVAVVARRG